VVERLREELDRRFGKGLVGSDILIVGIAYKKNVGDMRESPALTIMENLGRAGACVDYYDPYFPVIPPTRQHAALAGKMSIAFTDRELARYDAALIVTDHDAVDYQALIRASKLIVDTRNRIRHLLGTAAADLLATA